MAQRGDLKRHTFAGYRNCAMLQPCGMHGISGSRRTLHNLIRRKRSCHIHFMHGCPQQRIAHSPARHARITQHSEQMLQMRFLKPSPIAHDANTRSRKFLSIPAVAPQM